MGDEEGGAGSEIEIGKGEGDQGLGITGAALPLLVPVLIVPASPPPSPPLPPPPSPPSRQSPPPPATIVVPTSSSKFKPNPTRHRQVGFFWLVRLYRLAAFLGAEELRNEIVDEVARLSDAYNAMLSASDTRELWVDGREIGGEKLQRLVLDLFVRKNTARLVEGSVDRWWVFLELFVFFLNGFHGDFPAGYLIIPCLFWGFFSLDFFSRFSLGFNFAFRHGPPCLSWR